MTKFTKLDLAQFDGHTPGPWHVWRSGAFRYVMTQSGYTLAKIDPAFSYRKAHPVNAELFAAAPALLSECRRLQAENERLRGALENLVIRCDGAEGVRADGSNIDTLAAHAALGDFQEAE